MPAVILQEGNHRVEQGGVRVPEWVVNLESFRRWYHSDDFPEKGRIDYIQGAVWVDMGVEQIFSHVQAKTAITAVLFMVTESGELGLYLDYGLRLSNEAADLSAEPDGTFISNESMEEANIQLIEGKQEGYTEIEGVPDMVLEIISRQFGEKGHQKVVQGVLGSRHQGILAGRRPWRAAELRHLPSHEKGYLATRKKDGWLKSQVFGKSFRLTRNEDRFGHPGYGLEVR